MKTAIARRPSLLRGFVTGMLGGVVGSWFMTEFHVALYGGGVTHVREPQSHRPIDGDDDATTKAADVLTRAATGQYLARRGKQVGGPLVHYMFGAVMGAAYGVASEFAPRVRAGSGAAFGAVVWLGADELLMPVLNLARGPRTYPPSIHLEMLAAHLVYGAATDRVMSALACYPRDGGGRAARTADHRSAR